LPSLWRLADNWKLKLLALALAVLLWVVVSADQVTSNWIPVPLEVQVTDPAYRLIRGTVPDEVEVRFTGPGRDFLDLAIRRSPLTLTISDVTDTVEVFDLDPGMVRVPNQLSVNPQDVRPGTISLRFVRLEERLVPVRVRVRNQLGSEWTLVDSLDVEPSTIRVRGTLGLVDDITALRTEPMVLTSDDSVFSRVVPIDTTGLSGLQLSSGSVRVSGVVDRVAETTHPGIPISIGVGFDVRPGTAEVTFRGPATVIRAMTPDDYRVVVAIDSIPDEIPAGGVGVPVRIEGLPTGVTAVPTPRAVRLFTARPAPDAIGTAVTDTTGRESAGSGG
jgi:YbbR domain-containing protein